jgi:Asp-tRNA(Asn)/Glu-tRNA(Gln) amidotransferase A subunit family amidase
MSVPLHASARDLARLVATRALSPVEIVQATLDRIQEQNPALNAYVAVDADGALAAARTAERSLMHSAFSTSHSLGTSHFQLGTLFGVPVSIKSSISVKGLPWETGSRFREGIVGDADAPLVARLKAAGAIVIGVTNAAEQLMAWETDNALYGRTNNPWALDRTPGGSSGGEAAAIAAGLSAGGIGSDGGGSIRVPAHFCGICGLKPTPGRVPATGHFPPCAGPFALTGVVGPMARTVDDVETMVAAMAGPDIGDPNGHPVPFTPLASVPKGTRVGVFEDDGTVPVTAESRDAIRKAAAALRDAGCVVEEFRPDGLEEARELWWEIFGHAVGLVLEPMVAGREAEVHPNLLQFLEWTRRGPRLTAERLLDVEIKRDLLKTRFLAQMQRYPLLLCPVAPIPAFRHGEREWMVEGRKVHYLAAWRYTAWFNLLQNPAMSVPVSQSADGLPIGVQVVAAPWNEALVLAGARVIEAARGAWVAPPTSNNVTQRLTTPPNLTQRLTTPPNLTQRLTTPPNLTQPLTALPNLS